MRRQILNQYSSFLIDSYEKDILPSYTKGLAVNPIISQIASWYEKLRNAMEYREDEVILKSAIERILKRRLMLDKNGQSIAPALIRELIWAKYFPDKSISEKRIKNVAKTIDLYLELQKSILDKYKLNDKKITTWITQVMSANIKDILSPAKEKELIVNFMYHILKGNINITDDNEETRDIQVFVAVRKAFAKDDIALLRYCLFNQFFGELSDQNLSKIVSSFPSGYSKIEEQLNYPLKYKIGSYVKKLTPPFLILSDVLKQGNSDDFIYDDKKLYVEVIQACETRYRGIIDKVQRAVMRSIIFILLTKVFIALAIEGTYDRIVYGSIIWKSMAINILIPPSLMAVTSLFIKTPDHKNSVLIYNMINNLLFAQDPKIGEPVSLAKKPNRKTTTIDMVFSSLWLLAFILSFGFVVYILSKWHFNLISMEVFVFFLAIVCFLAYRINLNAKIYTVENKPGFLTPVVDFLVMPLIQVGRYLTEGISQINVLLFILDFIIETPFKGLFSFFEQWFVFLHTKRETLE